MLFCRTRNEFAYPGGGIVLTVAFTSPCFLKTTRLLFCPVCPAEAQVNVDSLSRQNQRARRIRWALCRIMASMAPATASGVQVCLAPDSSC